MDLAAGSGVEVAAGDGVDVTDNGVELEAALDVSFEGVPEVGAGGEARFFWQI